MNKKILNTVLNKNLWCFIFLAYLLNVHYKITEVDNFILQTMMDRYAYNDISELNFWTGIDVKYCILIFVIILVISVIYPKNLKEIISDSKFTKLSKTFILPITIIYMCYIFTIGVYSINTKAEYINDLAKYPKVIDITLNELENVEDLETAIVYIEREDCLYCVELSPTIENISKDYEIDVYKYNTIHDRDTNKEQLNLVLEKYDIDAVPTVLIVIDGEIKETLKGQEAFDIYEAIEKYKID